MSATISADRLGVATVQSLFICEEGLNDADQFAFQATFKDTAPSTFAWPFIEPHRSGRGALKVSCHPGTENCAATGGWDDPGDEVPVTPTSFDSRQARWPSGSSQVTYAGLDDPPAASAARERLYVRSRRRARPPVGPALILRTYYDH